jgi:hypothetical protein
MSKTVKEIKKEYAATIDYFIEEIQQYDSKLNHIKERSRWNQQKETFVTSLLDYMKKKPLTQKQKLAADKIYEEQLELDKPTPFLCTMQ